MENEIKLTKNNDERKLSDLELVTEFYDFLQGRNPEGILTKGMKLSKNKAFTIIWFLQEHLSVFPDHIEKCSKCGDLYDSHSCGFHSEAKGGVFYCGACCPPFIDEWEDKYFERQRKKELKNKKSK